MAIIHFINRPKSQTSDGLFGVFRRGNKPSVLPRDSKTSGATTKMARRMPSRKTLKREEPPV